MHGHAESNFLSVTVDVHKDVDLTKQKVGDKVVFEVTRVVAVSVEKQ